MRHLLSAITGIPALGALLIAAIPAHRTGLARAVALGAASLTLVLSIALWTLFEPRGVQWQFLEELHLAPSMGIGYVVGVDGLGALTVLLATVFTWASLIAFPSRSERDKARYISTLAIETGVVAAVASLTFVLFALSFIVAMLAAWRLLRTSADGGPDVVATRFLRYAGVAMAALLSGIVILAFGTAAHTFDIRAFHQLTLPPTVQGVVFALFVVPFAIVSGAFPFHLARRDVIASTPPAIWIPIGVVLSTLGMFGLMRVVLPIVPDAMRAAVPGIIVVATIGAAYGLITGARRPSRTVLLTMALPSLSVVQASLLWLTVADLSPAGLTFSILQYAGFSLALAMFALALAHITEVRRTIVAVGALIGLVVTIGIEPVAVFPRIETSVARIILRVSPQHAAEVADCLTASKAPPPPPDIPGLPAGASMAAPCDTSQPEKK